MPHVSSHKVKPDLLEKIFDDLIKTIAKSKDKNNLTYVFGELFTATEKIMVAKRLAILIMLKDKIPQAKICDVLKVSPSTVSIFSLGIESGQYTTLMSVVQNSKVDILELIYKILTLDGFLPPKVGPGRHRWRKKMRNM